jgi:hypothetical protein
MGVTGMAAEIAAATLKAGAFRSGARWITPPAYYGSLVPSGMVAPVQIVS